MSKDSTMDFQSATTLNTRLLQVIIIITEIIHNLTTDLESPLEEPIHQALKLVRKFLLNILKSHNHDDNGNAIYIDFGNSKALPLYEKVNKLFMQSLQFIVNDSNTDIEEGLLISVFSTMVAHNIDINSTQNQNHDSHISEDLTEQQLMKNHGSDVSGTDSTVIPQPLYCIQLKDTAVVTYNENPEKNKMKNKALHSSNTPTPVKILSGKDCTKKASSLPLHNLSRQSSDEKVRSWVNKQVSGKTSSLTHLETNTESNTDKANKRPVSNKQEKFDKHARNTIWHKKKKNISINSKKDYDTPKCGYCRKTGHSIEYCRTLAKKECTYCGGKRHSAKICKKRMSEEVNWRENGPVENGKA